MEINVVNKLKNSAMFHFHVACHKLNSKLRTALNLPPPTAESPKIFSLNGSEESGEENIFQSFQCLDVFNVRPVSFKENIIAEENPAVNETVYEKPIDDENKDMPVEDTVEESVEMPVEENVDIPTETPIEMHGETSVEAPKEKPAEMTEEKVEDKTAEMPEEKVEDKPDDDENVNENPETEEKITRKRSRSKRDKKPVAAARSPFVPLEPILKKFKINTNVVEDLPMPNSKPTEDYNVPSEKDAVLYSWVKKRKQAKNIGLVSIVPQFEAFSAETISLLHNDCQWLGTKHVDAIMQLLNTQVAKYPDSFQNLRWTCMNSLYNQSLVSGVSSLKIKRQMDKDAGVESKLVDWTVVDSGLYMYVAGFNYN